MRWWKLLLGVAGFLSLGIILRDYGFSALARDLGHVGWRLLPLSLTFIPTLACYTMVWYLVTEAPEKGKLRFWFSLFRITVIAIAWNNLSPFIKLLGEPLRLMELRRLNPDPKSTMKSVLAYNITHSMGTVLSFVLGAITIPLFFHVSEDLRHLLWIAVLVFIALLGLFWFLPWAVHYGLKLAKGAKIRRASIGLRWAVHRIRRFYREDKLALLSALFFSVSARFGEGLTFYYGFRILGEGIPLLTAAYLDVGRALADNAFFFIPYQVGSREYAVGFLLNHVFGIAGKTFVSAALLYRLVEIIWMVIGYLWWGAGKRNVAESIAT